MGQKLNCWEAMQCGLEPGGSKTAERGIGEALKRLKISREKNFSASKSL